MKQRPIKFKQVIWDYDKDILLEIHGWGFIDETFISPVTSGVDPEHNYQSYQFTGLLDKNGKEIYEGDIVKVPVEINQDTFGEYSYREIKFNNGGFYSSYLNSQKGQIMPRGYTASFIIEEPDIDIKLMLWSEEPRKIDNFEVIGDIYSNPELLK